MIATVMQRDETPHSHVVILSVRIQEGQAVWFGTFALHNNEVLERAQESSNEEDARDTHSCLFHKYLMQEMV